jgi:predicted transcriptional regulator
MLTKNEVLKSLKNMPNKFHAEDAIERIILLEKISMGIQQSDEGKVLTKDQARKRLKKWLK